MMKTKTEREKGIIALIILSFVFASMGLFARYLATGFLLFQQVYLRMFAAFGIGFFFFRKELDFGKLKKISFRDWAIIILRATSYALFGIILFTQAIVITKYSNVSFIGALPTTAILGFLLLREKFTAQKALLVLLAFVGVMLLAVKDYSHIFDWGRGEVLTLISTVFFALSYIGRKWMSPLLNNKELTVLNFLMAFLVVFFVSLFKGDGLPVTGWTNGLLAAVVGAGIFNIANVYLTNYGFQNVEAVLASNILTLESFFAIILGFLFFGEVPILKDLLGGLIIVGSVIAMNKAEEQE